MPNDASGPGFQSILAPFMDQFLEEKLACGYAYREPIRILHRLDDFLVQEGLSTLELPRSVVQDWVAKKPHESASTQQYRIILVRHLSRFLLRAGYPASFDRQYDPASARPCTGKSPRSSRTVRQTSFPERTRPTPITFGNPLHSSKISRQSSKPTSKPQPKGESTYVSTRERNAPLTERNLARHDSRFPRSRRCQNNSNLCEGKSRNETKRA